MNYIKNIVYEIFSLFVDDGSFVLATLIWLGIMSWSVSHLSLAPATLGVVLFCGLVLILCESVTRYARKVVITKNNTGKNIFDVH
jgi:hypothetical protein